MRIVRFVPDSRASRVARILGVLSSVVASASAQLTEFKLPNAASRPYSVCTGPDGNVWFTESQGNRIASIAPDGTIAEFSVPTAQSGPYGICCGPDGKLWFTERYADQIGRFDPNTAQFKEYAIPTPLSQPWEIATGPDGNLWFTEEDVDQIGRVTTQGVMTEFGAGTCCFPTGITAGVDGNLWYSIEIGDVIGRITPLGATNSFAIPSVQVLAWDVTPGPDGNLWFTELSGRAIGNVSQAGVVTEHPIAGPFSGITGITTGFDGNLWFTENDTDRLGSIDVQGNSLATIHASHGARPLGIVSGTDGNLWFAEADGNAIGRVAIAQPNTGYVISMDSGFAPREVTVHIGDRVTWMFNGPRMHSVVDASGLALFQSPPRRIVSYYSHVFDAAGIYPYVDSVGGGSKGGVTVLVGVPSSGLVNQPFSVAWSTSPPPAGLVFDVQVQVPGSSSFSLWQTSTQPSDLYTATSAGTYRFRSRLRDPASGAKAIYSRPSPIVIH